MTDPGPIHIPLDYVPDFVAKHRDSITITTASAAQIVALTDLPARLASLEQWAAQFPPLGVITENGKPVSVTGPVTFAAGGSSNFSTGMSFSGHPVGTGPTDDSAAEEALRAIEAERGNSDDDGTHLEPLDLADWQVNGILAAIRRGDVPLPITSWNILISTLRAEITTLRAEIAACAPAARALIAERDRLAAQVASLVGRDGRNYCAQVEAERDNARALLKEARVSLDMQRKSIEIARARYDTAHPDEAGKWPDRTDMVAWMMADYDKMAGELTEAKFDAECAKAARNGMHVGNYRELVAARADADALAGLLRRTINAGVLIHCDVAHALAEEIGAALAKHAGAK